MEELGARRFYSYGMGQEPWLDHILALGLSDDSPQVREAEALLMKARSRSFAAAERLFGKDEFFLKSISEMGALPGVEAEHVESGVLTSLNDDAKDEFVF